MKTGSREENARHNKNLEPPFRYYRNGNGSGQKILCGYSAGLMARIGDSEIDFRENTQARK